MTKTSRFIDARELAAVLNLPVSTVYRLSRQGIVPHFHIGRRLLRYDLDCVLKSLDNAEDALVRTEQ
jgi:predicted DNA-binding transcriptional regulator AlpA